MMIEQAGWVRVVYGNFECLLHVTTVKLFLQYYRIGLVSDCIPGCLHLFIHHHCAVLSFCKCSDCL